MVLSGWMCFWECVLAADVITSTVRCFRACIPSWCNPGNFVFCKNFLFSRTFYSSLFIYLFHSCGLYFSPCSSLASSQCFSIPYYHQTVNSAVSLAVCDSLASTNKASVCYILMRERRLFMGYGFEGGWRRLWWVKVASSELKRDKHDAWFLCCCTTFLASLKNKFEIGNSTPSRQSLHLFASTCCFPHRGSYFYEKQKFSQKS